MAGISWTSKTDYHFNIDGKARFPGLPNVEYNLPIAAQVRAPQQVMMSLVHDLNKQWSVMGGSWLAGLESVRKPADHR
ncbi:Uncharacterised protein [Kluyvera cryocrescens]|uniref:Uncharacterized protein n=1 Tax=Kluyvera cryocrescens TaxID=580 RepID=A0A485A3K8_KLUCR|nr:Uncharacterised protein [Kluyvera cryocrescens]